MPDLVGEHVGRGALDPGVAGGAEAVAEGRLAVGAAVLLGEEGGEHEDEAAVGCLGPAGALDGLVPHGEGVVAGVRGAVAGGDGRDPQADGLAGVVAPEAVGGGDLGGDGLLARGGGGGSLGGDVDDGEGPGGGVDLGGLGRGDDLGDLEGAVPAEVASAVVAAASSAGESAASVSTASGTATSRVTVLPGAMGRRRRSPRGRGTLDPQGGLGRAVGSDAGELARAGLDDGGQQGAGETDLGRGRRGACLGCRGAGDPDDGGDDAGDGGAQSGADCHAAPGDDRGPGRRRSRPALLREQATPSPVDPRPDLAEPVRRSTP